jgi:proteasome alpha subunit
VTGRGLANAYAQTLGTIFSSGGEKPYEVEIFVAEVGDTLDGDQVYRLTYDGQVADEHDYAAMGGDAESVATYLKEHYEPGLSLDAAIRLAVKALGHSETGDRTIDVGELEVAWLDRTRPQQRKFRRLDGDSLSGILADA